jgi:hypothetical protein
VTSCNLSLSQQVYTRFEAIHDISGDMLELRVSVYNNTIFAAKSDVFWSVAALVLAPAHAKYSKRPELAPRIFPSALAAPTRRNLPINALTSNILDACIILHCHISDFILESSGRLSLIIYSIVSTVVVAHL